MNIISQWGENTLVELTDEELKWLLAKVKEEEFFRQEEEDAQEARMDEEWVRRGC